MICWRISNYVDLSGIGGLRGAARWHNSGKPIVYTANSPASALLEVLVHLEIENVDYLPDAYTLLMVNVPDDLLVVQVDEPTLKPDWRDDVNITRDIGDEWLASGESSVLAVPSVIVPYTTNYLINPLHPDMHRIAIVGHGKYPYDPRMFKSPSK